MKKEPADGLNCCLYGLGLCMPWQRLEQSRQKLFFKKYENAYKDFMNGAFAQDKKSYKKLVEASIYWDRLQFVKAHKILDELLKKCTCTQDYMTVYRWKSLCYARDGRNKSLVKTYQTMLQYDMTNSIVWSDLGLTYMKMGKTKEARAALEKAISYDPQNAAAYNNMSLHLFKTGEWEDAMQYVYKTLELRPDMYQPMSTAAIISKIYGQEENAEKYCQMYISSGGNEKAIRAILATI